MLSMGQGNVESIFLWGFGRKVHPEITEGTQDALSSCLKKEGGLSVGLHSRDFYLHALQIFSDMQTIQVFKSCGNMEVSSLLIVNSHNCNNQT